MTMPNFLIIGAAKSGTTSLHYYLKQHPQIYMSPLKETNFFAYTEQKIDFQWWGEPPRAILRSITDLDSYCEQFRDLAGEVAIGETSPLYLYDAAAPERIRHYIPDAKLIAILRHPAERAFSHFTHLVRDNREPCASFSQALQEENDRVRANWAWDYYYRDMGFYGAQLARYFGRFDPSQIMVFLYEDLGNDDVGLLQEVFRFLGVADDFTPDVSLRYNISGLPKNRVLQDFLAKPNLVKAIVRPFLPQKIRSRLAARLAGRNLVKPKLHPEARQQLIEVYREDILVLQGLIGRDLSHWLE